MRKQDSSADLLLYHELQGYDRPDAVVTMAGQQCRDVKKTCSALYYQQLMNLLFQTNHFCHTAQDVLVFRHNWRIACLNLSGCHVSSQCRTTLGMLNASRMRS